MTIAEFIEELCKAGLSGNVARDFLKWCVEEGVVRLDCHLDLANDRDRIQTRHEFMVQLAPGDAAIRIGNSIHMLDARQIPVTAVKL